MACGGLAESWIPHNFVFILKAEIWQLLLEKKKESRRSVDVAGMTYTVDVIEFRMGFKLDIELYRYRYI